MAKPNDDPDRRRFMRILFDTPATLRYANRLFKSQVLDISIKGALVAKPVDWPGRAGERLILNVPLDDGRHQIEMEAEISHINDDQLGLKCTVIDVDSITELRRLVELNLGDDSLLERELEALSGSE